MLELLSTFPEDVRMQMLAGMSENEAYLAMHRWDLWARPDQMAPSGEHWHTWLLLAGRGFGKTLAAMQFIRSMVCGDTPLSKGNASRVAIIGDTAADVRDILILGDSGLLRIHPSHFRPEWQPSKRRLVWPNGAYGLTFSAQDPDQLRGPQFDCAACDELAKWQYAEETMSNLAFGLRLGAKPRKVIATTPRPTRLIRALMMDPGVVLTRGSTMENSNNLSRDFLKQVQEKYAGTRLGRQELEGQVLADVPGALWTLDILDRNRVKKDMVPAFKRIVVAIDPATQAKEYENDGIAETGIIVAGLAEDGRGYVLADDTCGLNPNGWARKAIASLDYWGGDCIIAEQNQGGSMVEAVIRAVRSTVAFKAVTASRGKHTRAEPIAALYEQDRISHVGSFPALEDQLLATTPSGVLMENSPDRMDALVWAFTELFPRMMAPIRIGSRGRNTETGMMW
jgi:phage terminase large subunit-like protein